MARNPWMKFYPSDWRGSTSLKLVSMAARGLWIEMICIMHEADPYGHLMHKDRKLGAKELAALVGALPADVEMWLEELVDCGVVEVKRNGVFYSRRMEIDEIKRSRASEHGKKGGRLTADKEKEKLDTLKGSLEGDAKPQKPEARDQSPEEKKAPPKKAPPAPPLLLEGSPDVTDARRAFDLYNEMAARIGGARAEGLTDSRRKHLNARMKPVGFARWEEAMRRVERSLFLCGEAPPKRGDRPFRLHLDMLLRPDNFQRLLEGFYGEDRDPDQVRESADPAEWSVTRWRRLLEIWHQTGAWNEEAGPEPGQPGYRGPPTGDDYGNQ